MRVEPSTPSIPSPAPLRARADRLEGRRRLLRAQLAERSARREEARARLALEPAVATALQELGHDLFSDLTGVLEEKLSIALQEVLEEPIRLRAVAEHKSRAATISFHVERGEGNAEDVLRGTGGSVANVLSVGLRLFALTTLDPAAHRRFLALDEQDCWLRPELVPRLARIVRDAARALGFQVLLVSHHDASLFEPYADRVIRLVPGPDGVTVHVADPPDAPEPSAVRPTDSARAERTAPSEEANA